MTLSWLLWKTAYVFSFQNKTQKQKTWTDCWWFFFDMFWLLKFKGRHWHSIFQSNQFILPSCTQQYLCLVRFWSCRLLRTNKASTNLDGKTGLATLLEILTAFGHRSSAITNHFSQSPVLASTIQNLLTYYEYDVIFSLRKLLNSVSSTNLCPHISWLLFIDKHSRISTISHFQNLLIFMFLTATTRKDLSL